MINTPTSITINCPNPPEQSGSHNINVYVWGSGNKTPVVCVHGLTRNARDFDYLAAELSKDRTVYCIDMAGRGKSERMAKPEWYNYGAYVSDIFTFLKTQQLTKIDWIGTSMGGLIGMMVAAAMPDTVHKIVINDIGALIPKEALLRIAQYAGSPPTFRDVAEARAYFADVYKPWNLEKPEFLEHILTHSTVRHADGSIGLHYDPDIAFLLKDKNGKPSVDEDVNLWEIWEHVKAPVMLLRGEKSDLLTKEVAQKMHMSKPHVELHEYPNTGHAPSLMGDNQIKTIKDWLAK